MDLLIHMVYYLQELYDRAFSVCDQRVADWPLMSGYTPTLLITVLYLLAVYIGPKVMRTRRPIRLKKTLVIYNKVMSLWNLYIIIELGFCLLKISYIYFWQALSCIDDTLNMRIVTVLWWRYLFNCVEMLDTIFFILRRKFRPLRFLHVFFHAGMVTYAYINVKLLARGGPWQS